MVYNERKRGKGWVERERSRGGPARASLTPRSWTLGNPPAINARTNLIKEWEAGEGTSRAVHAAYFAPSFNSFLIRH